MKLSDFNPLGNTLGVHLGETVLANDLLEIYASDGKAYRVDISDYAAVGTVSLGTAQTSEATGRIVAQTSIVGGVTQNKHRQAILSDNTTGNIFTLASYAASAVGASLKKYSAAGALLGTIDLQTTVATSEHNIFRLSNGYICCVWMSSTTAISFAIYTTQLVLVKAVTVAATTTASSTYSVTPISSGGFAVVYHTAASALTNSLVVFNNAGTVTLAATTVWTRTGTNGAQHHKMLQLSDGNLGVAISSSNTVSSIGLHYLVVSTAGGIVKAPTVLDSVSNSAVPELSVLTSYFSIAIANGTTQKAYVFNNAGTMQGAEYSVATTAGSGTSNSIKLLSDGTNFWLIHPQNTGSIEQLVKIPITGTNYVSTNVTTSTTQYNFSVDAFYEAGYICAVSQAATNATPTVWVVSTDTGILVAPNGSAFGTSPGTTGASDARVIPGGDRSFICMYYYVTTAGTYFSVGKYAETALIGVAQLGGAGGTTGRVYAQAGVYQTTVTPGSSGVAVDHSVNPVVGQKGTIMDYGVVLKGVGV